MAEFTEDAKCETIHMKLVNTIIAVISMLFPWFLKRIIYSKYFGFELAKNSRVGFSIVLCDKLKMGSNSKIGAFNIVKNINMLEIGDFSTIGNFNWISAYPLTDKIHYNNQERKTCLVIGKHAAITNRHLIDCTNKVVIGSYSIMAGNRTQILTHSIDLKLGKQITKESLIGEYCFVGTGCIILSGTSLPSFSLLAAGSVLTKTYSQEYQLYGGCPARQIKSIDKNSNYFTRETGFVA